MMRRSTEWCARWGSGLIAMVALTRPSVVWADSGLDLSGELWLGVGRLGEWVASLQVPLYYLHSDDFVGYGVHGAYRAWPQVLGGGVFLEPNAGLTSGLSNGKRESGLGGGLSFGYTFHQARHAWGSVKAGFDVAPVAARGFIGFELLLH
jgi:hypothetical protein